MNRLILVLGCHRSGTSLITKSLECLGVSLGDRLQPAAADNPSGFQEDLDIQVIDDGVLQGIGAKWDTLGPVDVKNATTAILTGYSPFNAPLIAANALRDRLSRFPLFGLKDPRLCRLLPFWRPIFQELGVEVSCVIALRHPSEVMHSLHARNGFSEVKGFSLWLVNMLAAMTEMAPEWKKVVVSYDSMISRSGAEIARMATALDLKIDEQATAKFLKFPDLKLRHYFFRNGKPLPEHDLVRRVYGLLYAISLGAEPIGFPSTGKFMAMAGELEKMAPLLRHLDALDRHEIAPTHLAPGVGRFVWPA